MKIHQNTYFYDYPIWKNRYLWALIILSIISALTFFYEKNSVYLVISLVFAFQFLITVPLLFMRPRFCKFTAEYIEYRDSIFKSINKINPGYLKSILISNGAIHFNRINKSTDILDFPSKDAPFFHKRIKSFARAYNLEQLKKIYLREKKVNISELLQNTFPLILIIMVSLVKGQKSPADSSVWLMIFFVIAGIISYYIRKQYRSFLLLGNHDITIKNSLFRASQRIAIQNIKQIDQQKRKFQITTYTNQHYKVSPSNDNFNIVKGRLIELTEDFDINSNLVNQ